jgi:hypothetical protein
VICPRRNKSREPKDRKRKDELQYGGDCSEVFPTWEAPRSTDPPPASNTARTGVLGRLHRRAGGLTPPTRVTTNTVGTKLPIASAMGGLPALRAGNYPADVDVPPVVADAQGRQTLLRSTL